MLNVRHILPEASEQTSDDLSRDPTSREYIIANHNRWSRTVLNFKGLVSDSWYELDFLLTWHAGEENRTASDFAAIGIDFLTEDGSGIDFTYVPGLTRTQIDPHSCYIAGPDYHSHGNAFARSARVQCTFFVPAPAKQLTTSIRSWRNSHPFTISDPKLNHIEQPKADDEKDLEQTHIGTGVPRSSWLPSRCPWHGLTHEPAWFSYAIVPGRSLFIRGQLINPDGHGDGALARVVFRDARAEPLPSPYPEIPVASDVGSFIDIPVHRQARRFTLELSPPAQAVSVDLGFQAWRSGSAMELVTPLEVSLEEDLLLENISGEDLRDATSFLTEAIDRLEQDPGAHRSPSASALSLLSHYDDSLITLTIQDKLRAIQQGDGTVFTNGQVSLAGFPAWPLPESLSWSEDPFQSPAWRLEFHSLSWLLDLAKSQEEDALTRSIDLAASWSQGNPWGGQRDPLSAYPLSTAVRAEVFVHLLALNAIARKPASGRSQQILIAETVRHAFVLAEIVSQNLFPHSTLHIRAACALLTLSQSIPHFPLASYWRSIALAHLRSAFDLLLTPEGSSIEQSQHYRLELVSLGLILLKSLESLPGTKDLQEHLTPLLRENLRIVVAVTDPAGMLPPIGDMPRGHHYASWMRRLISGYGRSLLLDRSLAEELSYPTGPRAFISEAAGLIALRSYERKPNWAYLYASFGEKRHENGHHDCTSFVYSSDGVRWVTDPGGANSHDAGPVRQYLISSRAHNIVIPDRREQTAGTSWVMANLSLEQATILQIGTNVYGPHYAHRRTFICLTDLQAIAVFDRFETQEGLIACEGMLHFEQETAVALVSANQAIGFRGQRRLQITPYLVTGKLGGMHVVNGCNEQPGSIQGFVSSSTGSLQPSNTLHYRFSGYDTACGGVILTSSPQSLRAISELLTTPTVKGLLESH